MLNCPAPLTRSGCRVIHLDMKKADGVDVSGDLTDPAFVEKLASLRVRSVLCSNVLEHVTDPARLARRLEELLPAGGYLIVTVPHEFPYHADPIDTLFRPPLEWTDAMPDINWVSTAGEVRWTQRLRDSCWASPIGHQGRVYFFGKDGVTTVIRAGKTFEKLATNRLWNPEDYQPDEAAAEREETAERRAAAAMFSGPVQYGVAVADDSFLIRTGSRLYRIGE
jgi:SAM-dependent methyltransferase